MTDSAPKRIQRKRTKGWKMPEGAISVTRPGRFGNPFRVGDYVKLGRGEAGLAYLRCVDKAHANGSYTFIETRQQAVDMFREYKRRYPFLAEEVEALRAAEYLACFCPLDQPCHIDVLLEIAN